MNEDEVTTNEETTESEQLPADASDDDLTVEELNQVSDEDFEKYHTSDITAKEIRDKYGFQFDPDTDTEQEEPAEDTSDNSDDTSDQGQQEPEEPETQEDEIADYEAAWKQVSAPFKANGKMYQPRNADDVVNLMQKGVNYTQKMQQIAPYRKVVETLKSNNIDTNELNFLIDLHNGNKDAIQSLLKRNKVDTMSMDYDSDKPDNYIPNNNMVNDQQVAVSEILDDISDNKSQIADIVYNKWDAESQKIIAEHPEYLRLLNEEINLGRFDTIQQALDQAKMFGRTSGMSDIMAYANLARAYEEVQQDQARQQYQNQQQLQQLQQEAQTKKKAAAPTRGQSRAAKRRMSTEDIWNMSDEDFEKLKYTDIQAMEQN